MNMFDCVFDWIAECGAEAIRDPECLLFYAIVHGLLDVVEDML